MKKKFIENSETCPLFHIHRKTKTIQIHELMSGHINTPSLLSQNPKISAPVPQKSFIHVSPLPKLTKHAVRFFLLMVKYIIDNVLSKQHHWDQSSGGLSSGNSDCLNSSFSAYHWQQ